MNIKEIAEKYKLKTNQPKMDDNDFWMHKQSGKWIIKHSACEKIGNIEGIIIAPPQILNSEQSFVRMVVTGKMGDKMEWTIGEADTKNSVGFYQGMICEKRAKDRVILKLIQASEENIYSSEETFVDEPLDVKEEHYNPSDDLKERFTSLKADEDFSGDKDLLNQMWKVTTNDKGCNDILDMMERRIKGNVKKRKTKEENKANDDKISAIAKEGK
tara:strand:- start:351 stop:995 length:645 start_codon:yes stop_codon:yes gene_type:complete